MPEHECKPYTHGIWDREMFYRCECGKRFRFYPLWGGMAQERVRWLFAGEFHHSERDDCCGFTRKRAFLRDRPYKGRPADDWEALRRSTDDALALARRMSK